MNRNVWACIIALGLLATACTAGGTATISDDGAAGDALVVEPTAPPAPTAVPEPTPEPAPEPTATPVPAPPAESFSSLLASLESGDCFDNAVEDTGEVMPSAPVDCNGEHEFEVFFAGQSTDGPDVAYRTDDDYTDGLFRDFCDPATIEFAGAPWDVLPFDVITWTPSELDWIAGDRSFVCTAQAGLPNDNPFKVGTAAGGNLVSNEGIVARATLGDQRDLYFSFQGSTLFPITDGVFELPNLTPQVIDTGIVFSSPLQDVENSTTRAFVYDFSDGSAVGLNTGLEGWEIASPHFILDSPGFVFAARETPEDDWDIYLTPAEQDPILLTDSDANDHWLTITPDESQIVYNSNGDIWIMNVDGSDRQQLTSDGGSDFESAVSPDGTQIVFASSRSSNDDIWIMDIDGSNQRNLTNHPANDAWPFFSADGSLIYFQTDRLGVRSNIMMMELDGSNQSYYSFEFMTNGALLPGDITARFIDELPPISEVLETSVGGVVPGAEGEFGEVTHSSERIMATLPSGWEFEEIAGADPALLAAASTSAFNTTWSSDGVLLTVIDAPTVEDFTTRLDAATAATDNTCIEDDRSTEVDGPRSLIELTYSCGDRSRAVVIGIYEAEQQAGLILEGQWDGDPSDEVDTDVIEEIIRLVLWR